MDKEAEVINEEIKQKFTLVCNKCENNSVSVEFWPGSHGDSGYLKINCQNCEQETYFN